MPEELQTIDDIVSKLLEIKAKYGNIKVAEIFYGHEDYPKVEVLNTNSSVVTNPLIKSEYVVIFD